MNKKIKKTFAKQLDQSDCGVACLAAIIRYHEGDTSIEKLREASGTTHQGTTLLGLYQAASNNGFNADALYAKSIENLKELQEPAILHVLTTNGLSHYVVFYGFDRDKIIIGDPANGVSFYTHEQLEKIWIKKALLKLIPKDDFVKRSVIQGYKLKWIYTLIEEDIGTLIVALSIGIATTLLGLSTSIFVQRLIDNILPSANIQKLVLSLILVFLLLLVRSTLTYARGSFIIYQGKTFNNRIIQQFYKSLLRLPKSFFDTRKTGDLIARMNDTQKVQATINMMFGNILIDILLIIVSTIAIFFYSWLVGVAIIGFVPFYAIIALKFSKPINVSQKETLGNYAYSEAHYVDAIQGISAIKTHSKESFFETLNQKIYGRFQDSIFKLGKINIRFSFFSDVLSVTLLMLVFGLTTSMIIRKEFSIGELVAVITLAGNIVPSMTRLIIMNIQIQESKVVLDRMFEFTTVNSEFEDSMTDVEKLEFSSLTVSDLCFRFPGRSPLLKNISFTLRKGEWITFLGKSGSGKSTLIQIIQKFYHPEAAEITVNDVAWKEIQIPVWRNIMGVVPQDIKIFTGTVLFNICLSDSSEDAKKAVELSQEYGFNTYFEKLPQGLLTKVGEDGINLSGGQKQLVALARALFNRPQLLVLDEPTSAMDRELEKFVLDLLEKLKPSVGTIMVTHRIKAAQNADRIYVIDEGRIESSGTPDELLLSANQFSNGLAG